LNIGSGYFDTGGQTLKDRDEFGTVRFSGSEPT
jgi:hypothetical protein